MPLRAKFKVRSVLSLIFTIATSDLLAVTSAKTRKQEALLVLKEGLSSFRRTKTWAVKPWQVRRCRARQMTDVSQPILEELLDMYLTLAVELRQNVLLAFSMT